MTAVIEGMEIFRTNREKAYKAIFELTHQEDPVLLERTYDSYMKQYNAIGGVPVPWQAGIESMITGFAGNQEPRRQTVPQSIVRTKSRRAFEAKQKISCKG